MNAKSQIAWWAAAARAAARLRPRFRPVPRVPVNAAALPHGISVVIPSRNGRDLLERQMPGIVEELERFRSEVVVVDNGSHDGTTDWLRTRWPEVMVEVSREPLGFARAVNRGIVRAQYRYLCLLNNDMVLDAGFFAPLVRTFDMEPDLFCATAQIRFPAGVRREETGKAVMAQADPEDFPLRCDDPLPGEDRTWVLYGSGGCSLYDARKLQELGLFCETYDPMYVEDLDVGYRAWQRGWPTVYVAGSVVEHRHRATTTRYYTEEQIEEIVEVNYLRFVARAVADRALFHRLWEQAIARLVLRAQRPPAARALRRAASIALEDGPADAPEGWEEHVLALTDGSVSVFPGGGVDGVLVKQVSALEPPRLDTLAGYREVVIARGERAFRAALEQSRKKWAGTGMAIQEMRLVG